MSENKESVLSKGSGLYILLGVAFAVLAMFFVTVVALESVLFSPSYYIKLEDSFKMSEQMDLTKDGYITVSYTHLPILYIRADCSCPF